MTRRSTRFTRRRVSTAPKGTEEERRGRTMSVGDALGEYLEDSGLLTRKKAVPAISAWNEAVGPDLAHRARAVSYRRGELLIEVDSPALLNELMGFEAEDLRVRADALLEGSKIRKLSFKLNRRS